MTKLTSRENIWQGIKFTLFSISAGIIQIIVFTLLKELFKLDYWTGYLIALIISVVYNFTLNRRYTFKSAANIPIAMIKIAVFYCIFTPLSTWWGDALDKLGWNEYIVLGGTMIINFITEFLYSRLFIYRKSMNTNDLADKSDEKIK